MGLEQIKTKERNCRLSKSSSSAIILRFAGSRWCRDASGENCRENCRTGGLGIGTAGLGGGDADLPCPRP